LSRAAGTDLPVNTPTPAPPARILILTAGFGEGHNAAARALATAFDTEGGPSTALVADIFALASPRLNAVTRRGYLSMINRAPRLWRRVYGWMDTSTTLMPRSLALLRCERRVLAELLARERPAAICSTYPIYGFLLEKLVRSGRLTVPHYNVVTDSISIHSLWWRAACDGWFLPNEDSAAVLREAGLPSDHLHVCGFPVHPYFSAHDGRLTPPDLATAGTVPRVLQVINSGTRHAETTAGRLLTETDWEITCAVGRDNRLRARLEALAAGRAAPTRILGWTDEVPHLLMTHHVVISKAGGATTQEAIAARCPMIVSQVIPGQEEGNYELLRRHGVGGLAETPEAVLTVCRQAFANDGRVWRAWRAALAPIARPAAARAIAAQVLAVTAARSATPPVRAA
jgi:processive 1,2-diacylglycerol beta-glucosyltransferase